MSRVLGIFRDSLRVECAGCGRVYSAQGRVADIERMTRCRECLPAPAIVDARPLFERVLRARGSWRA